MLANLLASIAVAASLADAQSPPITVSLNDGGQYNRGEYAQVQFRASADGYVLLLQTDQNGRVRVLFPLDPGDDNFIRGGKTYKVVGRDSRGAFYLDEAGGSGMVYAAWSKSPFSYGEFVRGDHWDYAVFDLYNAADDPESQLTDLLLHFTTQGFDYAVDRYIVYSYGQYASEGTTTYIGVSGWPWPTYYADGWSVGISFGCCYGGWWGYPAYGWGYPWYGWGYPAYGWGYPGYGYGYPVYGYPGYGYPGYGYPGYGYGYPGYRPYTFKPGGTITTPGNPYRPRGDQFAPRSSVFQTSYRDRPTYGLNGTDRLVNDAATISGRVDAGRRPSSGPTTQAEPSRRAGGTVGGALGGGGAPTTRRATSGTGTGGAVGATSGGARRPNAKPAAGTPATRSRLATPASGAKARGWTADGKERPAVAGRPRISASPPSSGRSGAASAGSQGARGGTAAPSGRSGSAGGRASVQPQGRPSGGNRPSAQSSGRPSGGAPAARGGSPSGGGARGGAATGGSRGGAAPSGGGGGGRRGR